VEPTFAQISSDPASNDAESKDPNVFSGSTRHVKAGLSVASAASSACGENCPGAIQKFDRDIEYQTAIVENVRSSMAQTDDLVGRVVEAVEGILLDLGTVRS